MNKLFMSLAALAVLVLSVAWMAGTFQDKTRPGVTAMKEIEIDAQGVYIVRTTEHTAYEIVAGSLEAKQSTMISARIMAMIDQIHVRAGDVVEQGDILVSLDEQDLQSRVSRAKANIDAVSARLDDATRQLTRARDLNEKGVVSVANLDKAQATATTLEAELEAARQQWSEAKTMAGFASITSPISGRIVDRFAEPGNMAQPGARLLSIYNPSSLRIEASIREQLAVRLKVGDVVTARIPSLDTKPEATIEEIVPAAQTGSRSMLVKARIGTGEKLYAGLYAELLLPVAVQTVITIPQDFVARVGQLDVVWLVQNLQAVRRYIKTGKQYDDGMVEVVSGLQDGDKLVAR